MTSQALVPPVGLRQLNIAVTKIVAARKRETKERPKIESQQRRRPTGIFRTCNEHAHSASLTPVAGICYLRIGDDIGLCQY